QVDELGHVVDERVVAARVEERVPVASGLRPVDEVLAVGRVGEDAVDVEDHRLAAGHRTVPPGPVLGGHQSWTADPATGRVVRSALGRGWGPGWGWPVGEGPAPSGAR